MRNLAELNINERGTPVERPAPSPAVVSAFEAEYGVALPADYLELLAHSNGGHPELDLVDGWGVDHFLHLSGDRHATNDLWYAIRALRPFVGVAMVPFAGNGGGDYYLLDVSTMPAEVCVCLHEEHFRIVRLGLTFSQFIDRLQLDPDAI